MSPDCKKPKWTPNAGSVEFFGGGKKHCELEQIVRRKATGTECARTDIALNLALDSKRKNADGPVFLIL